MAKIEKREVIQKLIDGLNLDVGIEQIPLLLDKTVRPVYVINDIPQIRFIQDNVTGDNSKDFTVPAGKMWRFLYGYAEFVSTATVGNRRIQIQFRDGTNLLWNSVALNVQTNNSTEAYHFHSSQGDNSENTAIRHFIAVPEQAWLEENQVIRFQDSASIDATDDIKIRFFVEEHDRTLKRFK